MRGAVVDFRAALFPTRMDARAAAKQLRLYHQARVERVRIAARRCPVCPPEGGGPREERLTEAARRGLLPRRRGCECCYLPVISGDPGPRIRPTGPDDGRDFARFWGRGDERIDVASFMQPPKRADGASSGGGRLRRSRSLGAERAGQLRA